MREDDHLTAPFLGFQRHDERTNAHVLSPDPKMSEASAKQLFELVTTEFVNMKRIDLAKFFRVCQTIGSGDYKGPLGAENTGHSVQEKLVIFDVFEGFEANDQIEGVILEQGEIQDVPLLE